MKLNIPPLSKNPSLAARFLLGVTWGLVFSDSVLNARQFPGLLLIMVVCTLVLAFAASLERYPQ